MRVLAVRAPYRSDGPSPERARPILPVKMGSEVQGYAVYDEGLYKFPIGEGMAETLDSGSITVVFEFDCGEAVAIRLIGDPQQIEDTEYISELEDDHVYTDQDPRNSS